MAHDCGFSSVSYFNQAFRRRYGMTPSDVRVAAKSAS
ncbi:AraC family transcriptional regulator [Klebsiella pneumoniae]